MPLSTTIPIRVNLKPYGRLYGVIDSIDTRTGISLGELSRYGFDHGPQLQHRIMMGVVEALLEKETLKGDCLYVVNLEIRVDGKIIHSLTEEFRGENPPKYPPNWRVAHKSSVFSYLPYENKDGEIIEDRYSNANRMRATVLPNFPEEVLIEWFYRHPNIIEDYCFLGFEKLQFALQVWKLDDLPGREAALSGNISERPVSEFKSRLKQKSWVHVDMRENGTWNTPILLMENSANNLISPRGVKFKSPLHLLEGHTRLSCLIALRLLGKANDTHKVWIVRRQV
jgi:hypothetical protein